MSLCEKTLLYVENFEIAYKNCSTKNETKFKNMKKKFLSRIRHFNFSFIIFPILRY